MMTMPSIFNNDLWDHFFHEFTIPDRSSFSAGFNPAGVMKSDVTETDKGYELKIDLPGYEKNNIQAELKDGYMTIRAEQNSDKEEKNQEGKVLRRERFFGSCQRTFYVGENVTEEDIKAQFVNGVLTVAIPKIEVKPQIEEKKFIPIEG